MASNHKVYRYTVEGRGTFPYDMLRYDESYPSNSCLTNNLDSHATERRKVELIHTHVGPGTWSPTFARWQSFLWSVIDVPEVLL